MKIDIPKTFMGIDTAQAYKEFLEREAEEEKQKAQQPIPPVTPQYTTLKDLLVEQTSLRDTNNNKVLLSYDKSFQALQQRNFQRHLRPSEAFQILIDNIEQPQSSYKPLAQDMLASYGEWLSLAIKREQDKLICYLDPENLIWNGTTYEVQGSLKHAGEHTFNINKKIKSQTYVDLNQFPPDLQVFLYSRPFDQLPEVMKTGTKRAQLYLPPENRIWPCGGGFGDFDLGGFCNSGASRGVRSRAP